MMNDRFIMHRFHPGCIVQCLIVNRRQFLSSAIAACAAARVERFSAAAEKQDGLLPTVRWGRHQITRLLVGHNPIKGVSHFSDQLSTEMRLWFADDAEHGQQLLHRCEQVGINTCQLGFRASERVLIEQMLQTHYRNGGQLHWIASFYASPSDRDAAKDELDRILQMRPRPIGVQQVGNTTDALLKNGKMEQSLENLKRFRDAGLLAGLGSHNHEAIDYAESKGWDLDFYQCSFYRSWFSPRPTGRELFEEDDRQAMAKTIRQVRRPCIAFKVLGANRHCQSARTIEQALRFALKSIKPSDVILVGMWQKHQDQVAENAALVRGILSSG